MPAPIHLDVSLADQAVAMAASLAADGTGGVESQDLVAAQNKAQGWCILTHSVCSLMDAHGCTNLFIPHGNVCASRWWVLMQVIKASQGLKRPAGDAEDDAAKVPKAKTAKGAAKSKARGRPKAKANAGEMPSAKGGEKVDAGEVPSAPEGGERVDAGEVPSAPEGGERMDAGEVPSAPEGGERMDAGEVPSAPEGEVPKKKTRGPRQKTSPEVLSTVWAGKVGSSGVVSSIEFDIGVSFSLLFSPPCLDVLVFQLSFNVACLKFLVNVEDCLLSAWFVLLTSHGCFISLMRSESKTYHWVLVIYVIYIIALSQVLCICEVPLLKAAGIPIPDGYQPTTKSFTVGPTPPKDGAYAIQVLPCPQWLVFMKFWLLIQLLFR